ncbi:hypothetical protein ACI798_20540 [Geodermatophilus sp. SYSU D01045]
MSAETTSPADLDTARRQLADAEAAAAQLRADVETRAAEALAARERRLAEFDAAAVDTITERMEQLRAEEAQAAEDFRAAVLADPMYDAWVRMRAATGARFHLDRELSGIAHRLGRPEHRTTERWGHESLTEEALAIATREASNRAADVADAYDAAREAAGAGDEGTPAPDTTGTETTETTTPEGRRVRVTRDLRTGAQTVVDVETGQPYTAPSRRAPVDDGVANGALIDRGGLTPGDGWVLTAVDL